MRPMESARIKNLLGALSIGISDKIAMATSESLGYSGETAAAIIQIGTMPRMSIEELSKALKLSHSATVRLVAKLTEAKLIRRVASKDRREARLVLSSRGKTVMTGMLNERRQILDNLTRDLSATDLAQLGCFVETMLHRIADTQQDAIYVCRYCNEASCPQDRCPTIPLAP